MALRLVDTKPRMQKTSEPNRYGRYAAFYLRVALGVGFLSAVADRFGIWGPSGVHLVAWGNFQNYLRYTATLNPWFPHSWIPAIGWIATIGEVLLGIALLLGFRIRTAAFCSGLLSLAFALGMVSGLGVKAPLNYSVFVVSAAAFVLAGLEADPWSIDSWALRRHTRSSTGDINHSSPFAA